MVKNGKDVYVKVTAINKEGGWYRVEQATPHPKKDASEILPAGLFYWKNSQEIKPKYNDTISYTFNKGIYKGNDKKKTIWIQKANQFTHRRKLLKHLPMVQMRGIHNSKYLTIQLVKIQTNKGF